MVQFLRQGADCVTDRFGSASLLRLGAPYALALALSPLNLSWAAFNGAPFFYFGDTRVYFAQASALRNWAMMHLEGAEPAAAPVFWLGRSLYYSAFAGVLTQAQSLWLVALAQAFVVNALICIVVLRAWPRDDIGRPRFDVRARACLAAVAVVLALSLLSTLGWFSALIMPDIFAAALVLAVAALVALRPRLARLDRVFMLGVVVFAIMVHDSHLLIVVALLAAAAAALISPAMRRAGAVRSVAGLAGATALGGAAAIAGALLLGVVTERPPARLPFLATHLIDMGPGAEYLTEVCPKAGYALCDVTFDPSADWITLLFDPERGLFAGRDPVLQAAIGAEQLRFALAVTAAYPERVLPGLAFDAAKQVLLFDLRNLAPEPRWADDVARLPRHVVADARASRIAVDAEATRLALAAVSVVVYAGVMAAVAAIAIGVRRLARAPGPDETALLVFAALLIAGVLANAVTAGVLASPYPRFQARVVWLIPLAAAVIWSHIAGNRPLRRHLP